MAKKENPNQPKLFMTAQEIVENYSPIPGDFIGNETPSELWERKANEAEDNGLLDSIKEQGVQVPVSLSFRNKVVVGGHHRIAAQHILNPNQFIAINYEDDPYSANVYDSKIESKPDVNLPHFDTYLYEYDDRYL